VTCFDEVNRLSMTDIRDKRILREKTFVEKLDERVASASSTNKQSKGSQSSSKVYPMVPDPLPSIDKFPTDDSPSFSNIMKQPTNESAAFIRNEEPLERKLKKPLKLERDNSSSSCKSSNEN
jgi:hypothetical protein